MRAFIAVFLAACVAGFAGCQTGRSSHPKTIAAVPQLQPAAATAAGLRAEDVSTAKDLYVAKCARCHKFYDPAQYGESEWNNWMAKMSRKARLKPEQQELLSRYLGAYRGGHKAS
jgi:hypothetical protein